MDANVVKAYDGGDQDGGDLAYFVGKQYGSGWLRTLGRFAFPILKRVVRVAGNVAQDALDNPDKPILNSIRDNALNEVAKTVGSSINTAVKRKAPPTTTAPYFANSGSTNNNKRRRRR